MWSLFWAVLILGGALAMVALAWRGSWVYGLIVTAIVAFVFLVGWSIDRQNRREQETASWLDEQMAGRARRGRR